MPWPQSSPRKYRLAVCWKVDATDPVSVKVDPELADFWATVQSDGYDLLVCDAQGVALAHQRTAWTYASKTGAVKITCPTVVSGAVQGVVYLYWGASSTVAADPSTTVSGTAEPGYVIPDATLPAVLLQRVDPVVSGNGTAPAVVIIAPTVGATLVAVPVPLVTMSRASQGGPELEDLAGIEVDVLDADGDTEPTTPANWWSDTTIRAAASPERGTVILVPVTPDEAQDALLRVKAYLQGPASGGLPARTVTTYAIIRGVAPTE